MKIHIRNMVCDRCKIAVEKVFKNAGIIPISVTLGIIEISESPSQIELNQINHNLKKAGFEIITDKNKQLTEQIKNSIVELIHHSNNNLKVNLSTHLTKKIPYDYTYLSNIFSEIEDTTIEKYFILQRIEKVKELLVYNELNLDQIAFKLGYSSSAYLSNQFKKITDYTPSQFKKLSTNKRTNLENL